MRREYCEQDQGNMNDHVTLAILKFNTYLLRKCVQTAYLTRYTPYFRNTTSEPHFFILILFSHALNDGTDIKRFFFK